MTAFQFWDCADFEIPGFDQNILTAHFLLLF